MSPGRWPKWSALAQSFGVTAALWLVLVCIASAFTDGPRGAGISLGIGALAGANLVSIAGLGRALLDRPDGRISPFPTLFWGAAKLVCLGTLIAVVMSAKSLPLVSVIGGLSALVVVPVLGGWVHGFKNAS